MLSDSDQENETSRSTQHSTMTVTEEKREEIEKTHENNEKIQIAGLLT